MPMYFLPQHLFDALAQATAFAGMSEDARQIIPFIVEDVPGSMINDDQFAQMFPNGANVSPTQIEGILFARPFAAGTQPAPRRGATPTELDVVDTVAPPARRGRRRAQPAPAQADLLASAQARVVAAPPVVVSESMRVLQTLHPHLREALATLYPQHAILIAEPPFERTTPRASGTGVRIVFAPVQGYSADYAHTGYVEVLRGYDRKMYKPSYCGASVFHVSSYSPRFGFALAEVFRTTDGGIDLFLLGTQNFLEQEQARTGTNPNGFFPQLALGLRQMEATWVHLDPARKQERFAAHSHEFQQFSRRNQENLASGVRRDLQQILGSHYQHSANFANNSLTLQHVAQQLPILEARLAEAVAQQNEQLDRLVAHPKAVSVTLDPQNPHGGLFIETPPLSVAHPTTGVMLDLGRMRVRLDVLHGCVQFHMLGQNAFRHPCLGNLSDTSSIDAAMSEQLASGNLVGAYRLALRFLTTLDVEHPWVRQWLQTSSADAMESTDMRRRAA